MFAWAVNHTFSRVPHPNVAPFATLGWDSTKASDSYIHVLLRMGSAHEDGARHSLVSAEAVETVELQVCREISVELVVRSGM